MVYGIFCGSCPKLTSSAYRPPTPSRLIATTNRPETAPPRRAICNASLRLVRAADAVPMLSERTGEPEPQDSDSEHQYVHVDDPSECQTTAAPPFASSAATMPCPSGVPPEVVNVAL